ncbi:MAG: hypothetical protein D6714_20685, partial [Bacteroidetes bacterium]
FRSGFRIKKEPVVDSGHGFLFPTKPAPAPPDAPRNAKPAACAKRTNLFFPQKNKPAPGRTGKSPAFGDKGKCLFSPKKTWISIPN